MAINPRKVVVGGVVAGVVMAGLDFIANGFLFAERNRAALEALNPALIANTESGGVVAAVLSLDLVFGIVLVWTYAAMRPRFGAGPKTAVIAGGQIWLVASLLYAFMTVVGMYSWSYFALGAAVALVTFVVPALIGAMLYKEGQ